MVRRPSSAATFRERRDSSASRPARSDLDRRRPWVAPVELDAGEEKSRDQAVTVGPRRGGGGLEALRRPCPVLGRFGLRAQLDEQAVLVVARRAGERDAVDLASDGTRPCGAACSQDSGVSAGHRRRRRARRPCPAGDERARLFQVSAPRSLRDSARSGGCSDRRRPGRRAARRSSSRRPRRGCRRWSRITH